MLHGNGSMIEDVQSSGLIDLAAKNYRVIVFDRPGFGHSDRPRHVVWTPQAHADLLASAFKKKRGLKAHSAWTFLGDTGRSHSGAEISA